MKRTATRIATLEDARSRAEHILPDVLFGFLEGAGEDERTFRENKRIFDDVWFRFRAASAPADVDLSTKVLGTEISLPVVLGPVGPNRLLYPDGDRAMLRAAGAAGTAAVLSSAAGTPPADVIAAATGPAWYQLYFHGGRSGAEAIVDRAQRAGYGALFVTMDVVDGSRQTERTRHQLDKLARLRRHAPGSSGIPLGLNLQNALVFAPLIARRPRWTLGYVRDGLPTRFGGEETKQQSEKPRENRSIQYSVTWEDMGWIREMWKGPLVAKGILTGEDARRALDCGVEGILVSNHGGRYVDGAIPTLRALPGVRRAVGDSVQVFVDGGIRRGSDVVKAIALGADAAFLGRAYAYGLAAAGEAGVAKILEIFRMEIAVAMKRLGLASVGEIDETAVDTSRFVPA